MDIRLDDLNGQRIVAFLREHVEEMNEITPRESIHALDVDALRVPEITFWSAWQGDELVGCGALRELDARTGEIKSMRTARPHRGTGVARRILQHIVDEARARGYEHLYLETGALSPFLPARLLYERNGFTYRGPFGTYTVDPNTVFMEKAL